MALFDELYGPIESYVTTALKSPELTNAANVIWGTLASCKNERNLIFLKKSILLDIPKIEAKNKDTLLFLLELSNLVFKITTFQCYFSLLQRHVELHLQRGKGYWLAQAAELNTLLDKLSSNVHDLHALKTQMIEFTNTKLVPGYYYGFYYASDELKEGLDKIIDDIHISTLVNTDAMLTKQLNVAITKNTFDPLIYDTLAKLSIGRPATFSLATFIADIKDYILKANQQWTGGWVPEATKLVNLLEGPRKPQSTHALREHLIELRDTTLAASDRLKKLIIDAIEAIPSREFLIAQVGALPDQDYQLIVSKLNQSITPLPSSDSIPQSLEELMQPASKTDEHDLSTMSQEEQTLLLAFRRFVIQENLSLSSSPNALSPVPTPTITLQDCKELYKKIQNK